MTQEKDLKVLLHSPNIQRVYLVILERNLSDNLTNLSNFFSVKPATMFGELKILNRLNLLEKIRSGRETFYHSNEQGLISIWSKEFCNYLEEKGLAEDKTTISQLFRLYQKELIAFLVGFPALKQELDNFLDKKKKRKKQGKKKRYQLESILEDVMTEHLLWEVLLGDKFGKLKEVLVKEYTYRAIFRRV